jgi:GTP-binding protein YchF
MRVAVVGFPYSGKTAVFCAMAGIPRDQLSQTEANVAAVRVPEPRLDVLEKMYEPKKRTEATLEFVDLPGSAEGDLEKAGLSKHLPTLRQSDALLVVLRAFESDAVPAFKNRVDPKADLALIREEMLFADLLICDGRVEKLEAAVKKPTKDQEKQKKELELLKRCKAALEAEKPLRDVIQAGEEEKMVRSFGFLTQKPMIVALNVGEAQAAASTPDWAGEHAVATATICAPLELDLAQMAPADRAPFLEEYGLKELVGPKLVRACFDGLGLIFFLTAGPEEVRAWPLKRGSTAVEAAAEIHSDIARGFIRAETVAFDDLAAAGSMRDAKAANKVRLEPKHYVFQDGDVVLFKFNV